MLILSQHTGATIHNQYDSIIKSNRADVFFKKYVVVGGGFVFLKEK